MAELDKQPVSNVRWLNRDELTANDYNPNAVAPPELKLLKISILEDGWTQPIVVNPDRTIVDGYHRWRVSEMREVKTLTGGLVPVVELRPRDLASQQMATIRHNRARGTHAVLRMATIVESMVHAGLSVEEIMFRLGMEKEEVVRLAMRVGIPQSQLIRDTGWSKAWVPK